MPLSTLNFGHRTRVVHFKQHSSDFRPIAIVSAYRLLVDRPKKPQWAFQSKPLAYNYDWVKYISCQCCIISAADPQMPQRSRTAVEVVARNHNFRLKAFLQSPTIMTFFSPQNPSVQSAVDALRTKVNLSWSYDAPDKKNCREWP